MWFYLHTCRQSPSMSVAFFQLELCGEQIHRLTFMLLLHCFFSSSERNCPDTQTHGVKAIGHNRSFHLSICCSKPVFLSIPFHISFIFCCPPTVHLSVGMSEKKALQERDTFPELKLCGEEHLCACIHACMHVQPPKIQSPTFSKSLCLLLSFLSVTAMLIPHSLFPVQLPGCVLPSIIIHVSAVMHCWEVNTIIIFLDSFFPLSWFLEFTYFSLMTVLKS